MTGLLRKWGLGVELMFEAGRSMVQMTRATKAVATLKMGYEALGTSASRARDGLAKIGLGLAPLGIGMGLLAHQASGLAADLEAQQLTMRVLLGSQEKAAQLMGQIKDYAASTPFEQGDLIEGSKRLLKLTGDNVGANMDLLKLTSQMAALNPGRSMADAAEAVLDAAQGTGFERIKELGFFTGMSQDDFKSLGKPGGKAWADGIIASFRQQVTDKLKGGDLVAELGNTFTGRMSTLKDAFSNALLPIGEAINKELGPMLPELGAKIGNLTPVLVGAAQDLIGIIKGLAAQAQPYLDKIAALWERMGTGGQKSVVLLVMGVGALVAALTPLAGVAAAVGLVVSGIASLAGAIAPLIGPEALAVLAGIVAALAAVAGAAFLVFEVFKQNGEGPLDFLIRIGSAVQDFLIAKFEQARVLWAAAGDAFMASFQGIGGAIERIKGPAMELWAALSGIFGGMQGGAAEQASTWTALGDVLGHVANVLVDQVAAGIEGVTRVATFLTTAFGPLVLAAWQFQDAMIGSIRKVSDGIATFKGWIVSAVEAVKWVRMFATVLGEAFAPVLGAAREFSAALAEVFTGVGNMIKGKIADALGAVRAVVEPVLVAIGAAITRVVDLVRTTIADALGAVTDTVGPPVQAVGSTIDNLVGFVADKISAMVTTVSTAIATMSTTVSSMIFDTFAEVLRQVVALIASLPGGQRLLDSAGDFGSALAGARQSFSDSISETSRRIAAANTTRESEKAGAAAPQVTVNQGETVVQANVTTEVKVNDKELARAVGGAQVKAGQRQGRELPHHQAGRVLRGNGTVTPLRPYEILPTT